MKMHTHTATSLASSPHHASTLPSPISVRRPARTRLQAIRCADWPTQEPTSPAAADQPQLFGRRALIFGGACAAGAAVVQQQPAAAVDIQNDRYATTPSGLKFLDVKEGSGEYPQPGDTVVVHWAGYTKGYQAKRIDNTSVRDEPYAFVLGKHEAIPAFEEAVSSMRVGGIRRVEIPGELPQLSYPRDRSQRFTNELIPSSEGKIYKYRYGPQPYDLGGQRSLDFVLDNPTLYDLNRTLLMDIKLLRIRRS